MSIDSATSERNHDLAIIEVQEIKRQMGWRVGDERRTINVPSYLALMEAEDEAERTLQVMVRAKQREQGL